MKRLYLSFFILCFTMLAFFTSQAQAAELLTLKNANQRDVYGYILTENLKKGLMLQTLSDYSLIFEDTRTKSMPFIVNWGTNSKVMLIFNVAPLDENAIVSCELQIISNPGSTDEKVHVASIENARAYPPPYKEDLEAGSQIVTSSLRSIKATFNGIYLYGFNYVLKQKEILVLKVWPDKPAEKAGLLAGDRIVKINGLDLATLEDDAINGLLQTGEAGTTIRLTALRNGQEIELKMTKQFLPPTFKRSSNGSTAK
ncbi:MAG: carboxyl-terminal protease [Firmicutes bacterium]|nr:carboxyl-terminal protease [Bacillota bacterium]